MSQPPRGILLDIEGTTSSISFVHDVMFPFVLEQLETFLGSHFERPDVQAACQQIARDAGFDSLAAWQASCSPTDGQPPAAVDLVNKEVRRLMAGDHKATGLKTLQGVIWKVGFDSQRLQAHVYPDVLPAIGRWREAGIDVRIYSSGSIAAQKLFFGHVQDVGDCLHLFSGHYDTTSGDKKQLESYLRIAEDWSLPASSILFVSDVAEELYAAEQAGLQVCASVRPGNAPLPGDCHAPRIESFAELNWDA